jgi:hypothetical protein
MWHRISGVVFLMIAGAIVLAAISIAVHALASEIAVI